MSACAIARQRDALRIDAKLLRVLPDKFCTPPGIIMCRWPAVFRRKPVLHGDNRQLL